MLSFRESKESDFCMHFIRVSKKISTTFEQCRKYSGDFWRLPNDAVSVASSRSRHSTFRTTDWNILGGDWIQVFQFNGLWQVVRNFESGIDVFHLSWLCNELVTLSGQRVCRGLFCPVQLINPKIILPVGEGGELLNNVLYGKAPPPDLTPYTFIVEGARRVF